MGEYNACMLNDHGLESGLLARARALLNDAGAAGACLALRVEGEVVLDAALGFRDLDKTSPLEAHDRFYIYSATKTLIAAAVLQLLEAGYVRLDAPLAEYLDPEERGLLLSVRGAERVTIRQALNHTGGLPDYGPMRAYHEAVRQGGPPWSAGEFLRHTLVEGLLFEPGQGWRYSNIGYLLLRRALETMLGADLQGVLQPRIFAPLGLERTRAALTLADAAILTPGWSAFYSGGALEDVRARYHPGWVSHGVVISTAGELARMVEAVFSGELIGESQRAAMLTPVTVPVHHALFRQPGYGLGVMIDSASPWGLIAGHGGGGPGYTAGVLHLPDWKGRSITCAALVNDDRGEWAMRLAYMGLEWAARTLS